MDCRCQAHLSMEFNSPGKSTGVDCHSILQGIFPTLGSNPDLLHCRRILYYLSHQGSPRIQEWVAYPFSRGSSWPRNRTGVSHFAGGFFTSWATREALLILYFCLNKSYTIGLCSIQIFFFFDLLVVFKNGKFFLNRKFYLDCRFLWIIGRSGKSGLLPSGEHLLEAQRISAITTSDLPVPLVQPIHFALHAFCLPA